ncbi:hypothetical protein PYW08_004490 [Mythimna loreyi]|uniref:Uncharacterized protein n=1 Tax=Mythimna loreyi TaxID=667449 RepID=A0ACC2QT60_9NEOP|nr:hypothetical protein PYW08_004490 [Mythimna loreyi]
MFSGMCGKNTLSFIAVVEIVLSVCLFVECGRVKRVVGGRGVDCGTQPRVASLRNSTNLHHLCGATLISAQFAVTAAHCVLKDRSQYILLLNNYCGQGDEPTPRAEVVEIIRHPSYDPITRAHDVALLRIALHLGDVTWLNHSILPTSSFGLSGECVIYGYGYKDVDTMETSEWLSEGTLRIVSMDECLEALGPHRAPRPDSGVICAVGDGVDACQGDSGSPLICSGVIQGVSSFGTSCAVPGLPGVYASIGAHLAWIKQTIREK